MGTLVFVCPATGLEVLTGVWLQNANHPTMPNIMIRGVVVSLKD